MNGDDEQQLCDPESGACECAAAGVWTGPTCSLHKATPEAKVFINEIGYSLRNLIGWFQFEDAFDACNSCLEDNPSDGRLNSLPTQHLRASIINHYHFV
jgi:hypothetical protein